MAISDYSTTPASNTSLSGIDISGTTGKVKDGDNAIRQIMADIKAGTVYLSATSTFLAEATDAGATAGPILDLYRNSATPANADILGKVLFNGEDSGGGTQEYASIEAVIVDVTAASEDGQLDFYVTKAGARTKFQSMTATATAFTGAAAYTFDGPLTLTSTDAGATAGPVLTLYRDSATPAASDILGQVLFNGEDSAGNTQEYASIQAVITDPTSTSEDSTLDFYVQRAGVRSLALSLGAASAGPITAVRRQIFTSSGTYTPDATMVYALIECWGSGGGGGGVVGSATGTRGGGGGGAGGYSASIKTAAQVGASQTVTIGAGGTGSSGAAGGAGGATSVGSLVVANGGGGGGLNNGSTGFGDAGAGGSVGTGDDARLGGPGFPGNYATITTVMAMGGQGGGVGGASGRISLSSAGAGNNANVAGGGGSGGAAHASSSSVAGGSGGGGIVVITEYCVF